MAGKIERERAFLSRLAADTRGNVLAMSAAALIPLLAMVGGAIDVSRIYMAHTRLQQACDAGALAGRKAMANATTLTDTEKAKANEFFDFNFPTKTYSAANIVRTFAKGTADGVVTGSASIDMPTTIMKMFGYTTVPLSVTCESTLSIPNTDVMFVLDVTGSMLETPSGDTVTKIDGLKQAVKDFYAALGPGTATGAGRVRYGFMPYSSNVNVGKIVYNLNHSYIVGGSGAEEWKYQSRVPVLSTNYYVSSYGTESAQTASGSPTSSTVWDSDYDNYENSYNGYPEKASVTQSNCSSTKAPADSAGTASSPTSSVQDETMVYPDTTQTRTYTGTTKTAVRRYRYNWNNINHNSNACRLQYDDGVMTTTTTTTSTRSVTWQQKFASWNYQQKSYDVSSIVQNGTGANPAYFNGYAPDTTPNVDGGTDASGNYYTTTTASTVTWGGCIEEASTVNTITVSSTLDVPSAANDLKIDLIPSDTTTRWAPYLPQLQYQRNSYWLGRNAGWISQGYAACPREASPMTQYQSDYNSTTKASASFNTYVDSLTAVGGTYHDIGLIWGARFLSPNGIYSATNSDTTAPGGFPISRHIVFMTDGTLDTKPNANDPWGINNLDGRVAPTSTDETALEAVHRRRTQIICNAMQGKGYTVWVIGFGISDLPDELKKCANDSDHWSVAKNSAALKTQFSTIAKTIGGLRLSS